jgi:hypothetical protein
MDDTQCKPRKLRVNDRCAQENARYFSSQSQFRLLSFNTTIFGTFHFLNSIQIQISHRARIKPFAKYPKTHFPKGTTEAIILGQPVLPLDVEEVLCGAISTDSHDSLFVVVRSGKKGQIAQVLLEHNMLSVK